MLFKPYHVGPIIKGVQVEPVQGQYTKKTETRRIKKPRAKVGRTRQAQARPFQPETVFAQILVTAWYQHPT